MDKEKIGFALKSEAESIEAATVKAVAAAKSHHITLSYFALFLTLISLLFGGWMVHRSLQSSEVAMAKADARYSQWMQEEKVRDEQYRQHEDERDAREAEQSRRQLQTTQRHKDADSVIAQVMAPDKGAEAVVKDVHQYLRLDPLVEPDGRVGFSVPDTQGFIKMAIEGQVCKQDLDSTKADLSAEKDETRTLREDLTAANASINSGKDTVKQTQKAAKKSKVRKVADALEKSAGLIVAGGLLIKILLGH